MDPTPPRERVTPGLAQVWGRNLPGIRDRVTVLERAASSLERGDQPDRQDAADAAHKLAGSLGSYGLTRGSEIARELEQRFAPGGNLGEAAHVGRLVTELRLLIEG